MATAFCVTNKNKILHLQSEKIKNYEFGLVFFFKKKDRLLVIKNLLLKSQNHLKDNKRKKESYSYH